jgi:hypothetical protein
VFQLQTVDAVVDFSKKVELIIISTKRKLNYIMENNSTEKNSGKKTSEKYVKVWSEFLKGSKLSNVGGHRYEIKLNPSKSCAVSVTDKAVKGTNNAIIRFDRPHKNVYFNHININPRFSGKPDPHLKLPPGGLSAAETTAKFCKIVNKVAIPVALFIDIIQTGLAVREDYKKGTTRNTVETVAGKGGGWLGGCGGAVGGTGLGTVIFPGVGTIIGGLIGGITGGIGGSVAVSVIAREIGDIVDYDIIEIECEKCKTKLKFRKYLEHDFICLDCEAKL